MTRSVRNNDTSLVTIDVTSDGRSIPDHYIVAAISVTRALGRLPVAEITITDGDIATQSFPVADSDTFVPGARITINAGYSNRNALLFDGIVLGQSLVTGADGPPSLVVRCGDRATALMVARHSRIFTDMTDGDAVSRILGDAGIMAAVSDMPVRHPHLVQTDCSDWDFILSRAAANGCVVDVDGGKLTIAKPDFGAPTLDVAFGDSMLGMNLTLDAAAQLSSVTAQSWSAQDQALVTAGASAQSTGALGNLSGETLSNALGAGNDFLRSNAPPDTDALQRQADARLLESRMARIGGAVSFLGNAAVVPGKTLLLKGVGDRFNGAAYVTGIHHRIDNGNWQTDAHFGTNNGWFADPFRDALQIAAPCPNGAGNSGNSGNSGGLQIAKVLQVHGDPDGGGRIKVAIPLQGSGDGIWVRIASPYAGSATGITFLPEVGDEMVIGYLGGDTAAPVALGALHSTARPAPFAPDDRNSMKSIVTKSNLTMGFDDENKVVTITTPGGHCITLSDDSKAMALADSNGNTITMDQNGIAIATPQDLHLTAKGQVQITGKAGIDAQTPAGINAAGGTVTLTAETELSAKGGAAATVSAGGELALRAAMIMIN